MISAPWLLSNNMNPLENSTCLKVENQSSIPNKKETGFDTMQIGNETYKVISVRLTDNIKIQSKVSNQASPVEPSINDKSTTEEGIGTISSYYSNTRNNDNKIYGELLITSDLSNLKSEYLNKGSLLWAIYSINDNNVINYSKTSSQSNSAKTKIFVQRLNSNQIQMSLLRVVNIEKNIIYFDGFEEHIVDKAVVLHIIPYVSHYHKEENFHNYPLKEEFNDSDVNYELNIFESADKTFKSQSESEHDSAFENESQVKCNIISKKDIEMLPISSNNFNYLIAGEEKDVISYGCYEHNYHEEFPNVDINTTKLDAKNGSPKTIPEKTLEVTKYKCSVCSNKYFKTRNNLDHHLKLHSGKKPYICALCEKAFVLKNSLCRHIKLVHNLEKPYECYICKQKFSTAYGLRGHIITHRKTQLYKCFKCKNVFDKKDDFAKHNEQHKENFASTQNFEDINNPKPVKPPDIIDNTTANSKFSLQDPPKIFKCLHCEEQFDRENLLTFHAKKVHNTILYICNTCSEVFASKIKLRQHMPTHRTYKCSICMSEFKELEDLNFHTLLHVSVKPFKCNVCGNRYSTKYNLLCHVRIHTGQKPYQCSECGKSFHAKSSFNNHLKVHNGFKPHKCSSCNYCSSTLSDLKKHIRIHTGEKPYSCNACDKKFATGSSLRSHEKSHGSKFYKCNFCESSFTRQQGLKRHLSVHTGEESGNCHICGKKYSHKKTFKRHLLKFHGVN